jgi:iron complex outermembrane receptor protein
MIATLRKPGAAACRSANRAAPVGHLILAGALATLAGIGHAHAATPPDIDFNVSSQPVIDALEQLATQAHIYLQLPATQDQPDAMSPGVHGLHPVRAALTEALSGTGLRYDLDEAGPVAIARVWKATEPELQEILVKGTLNADIHRESGAGGPIVLRRSDIENSRAHTVSDLLRLLLPSLSAGGNSGSTSTSLQGSLNFRGLGADETLLLIDGRRLAAPARSGSTSQPDISAIPPAAIERIEIQPATASGVYGGGSSGGVINIVLRHECEATRIRADIGGTAANDFGSRGAFLSACAGAPGDPTQLLLVAALSAENALLTGDRDFYEDGQNRIIANTGFPGNRTAPPLGTFTNILSAQHTGLFGPGTPVLTNLSPGDDHLHGPDAARRNAGNYSLSLADSAQSEGGSRAVLRQPLDTRYLNATLKHTFSADHWAYLDTTWSRSIIRAPASFADYAGLTNLFLPATAPGNFFEQDIFVTVPAPGADGIAENRLESRRIVAGTTFRLCDRWRVSLEQASFLWRSWWTQPVSESTADAAEHGPLNVLSDTGLQAPELAPYARQLQTSPLDSLARVTSLRLGGALFDTPRGRTTLSISVEHRDEETRGGTESVTAQESPLPGITAFFSPEKFSIDSILLETNTTLRSRGSGVSGLEWSLGGRIDRYIAHTRPPRIEANSTEPIVTARATFTTANPMIRFRYRMPAGVLLRWGYATGFRPPSGSELAPPSRRPFPAGVFRDPARGNESTGPIEMLAGGNPSLVPAVSRSKTIGITVSPGALPGLTLSLDYTNIRKTGDIRDPADLVFTDFASFATLYPDRITRKRVLSGEPFAAGQILEINSTALNIAEVRVEAWDAALQFESTSMRLGTLRAWILATWQPTLETQASPLSPRENEAGVSAGSPQRFGAAASLTLTRNRWTLGWQTRLYGSYRVSRDPAVIEKQGATNVPTQILHDAFVSYRFATHGPLSSSIDVQINVQNVLGTPPAFDASAPARDYTSALGDPRLMVCGLSVTAQI